MPQLSQLCLDRTAPKTNGDQLLKFDEESVPRSEMEQFLKFDDQSLNNQQDQFLKFDDQSLNSQEEQFLKFDENGVAEKFLKFDSRSNSSVTNSGDSERRNHASPELRMKAIKMSLRIALANMKELKTSLEVGLVNLEPVTVMTNAERNVFLRAHASTISPAADTSGAAAATTAASAAAATATASQLRIQWISTPVKNTRRKVPVDRVVLGRCGDRWYAVTHYDLAGDRNMVQVLESDVCYLRPMACTPNKRVCVLVDPAYPIRAPLTRTCARAELHMFWSVFGQALSFTGSKTLAVMVSRREKRK